ncbi:alpha/beta fold hydrolase [Microbacterium sp. NPDC058389]|uniref:alpha/beta fold hydrolase n=1 Tax=Microbacterium sp. NPDC058389 TaxID=3346475 RepID=UPI00366057CA
MTSLSVRRVAAGTPNGPAVLLIHGLASRGSADWPDAEWAAPLAAAGRDVYVVDLPAHGDASRPQAPVTTTEVVDLLAGVVRDAGDPVDVVAYSLGARLAWDLAGRTVDGRPAVRRLVLGGLSPFEPLTTVDLPAARAALDGGPEPADPLTAMMLGMARMPGLEPAAVLHLIEGLAAEPFDPAAAPPRVPVLLAGGVDDPMAQGIDALAAGVADARVVRVPGDHLGALHDPAFRDAAQAFVLAG